MNYSEEEITQYTNIIRNFEDGLDVYTPVLDKNILLKIPEKVSCENCRNTHFFKDHGFRYCNKCFYSVSRVFIKDFSSKDSCHFQKKSVYKRSYHYQNTAIINCETKQRVNAPILSCCQNHSA